VRLCSLALAAVAACGPPAPPAATPKPAAVVEKEGNLLKVKIAPAAEARLGIRAVAVELRQFERARSLAGEVTVPPGRSVVISAPCAGSLTGENAAPGGRVEKDQILFTLTPFFVVSPDVRATLAAAQAEARGDAASAEVELEAAKASLDRSEQLLRDRAGSQRAVDEATARRDAAQASLTAAQARRDVMADAFDDELQAVDLKAPFAGILRTLLAAPGQQVAAGAPLLELADLARMWVRVPVFVGELDGLDAAAEIVIEGLPAKPVAAPPSADASASTADLFYEVENSNGALRPGQKVAVALPVRGEEQALSVPWSAVLHDIHGGTWVYEQAAPQEYVRRRLQVRRVERGWAALAGGPPAGTMVVAEGAAELYGVEFGHAR